MTNFNRIKPDDVDFSVTDLPDGVTIDGKTGETIVNRKRRNDIFSIITDAKNSTRKTLKSSLSSRDTNPPVSKADKKPGKATRLLKKSGETPKLSKETKALLDQHGKHIDAWMLSYINDNTALIDGTPREKGKFLKHLVIASMMRGPATFERHVERINWALDSSNNETGFLIIESEVRKTITSLRTSPR